MSVVSWHSSDSKLVKQEVNGRVILPPLVFPGQCIAFSRSFESGLVAAEGQKLECFNMKRICFISTMLIEETHYIVIHGDILPHSFSLCVYNNLYATNIWVYPCSTQHIQCT